LASNNDYEIGECLQQKKNEIFRIWESRVRAVLPVAQAYDSLALTNSLPDLYDRLIETLSVSDSKKYVDGDGKNLGKEHGEERSRLKGYDLSHVIDEYQILRQVIFEVIRKCGPVSDEASDVILNTISTGIRNATVEFVRRKTDDLTKSARLADIAAVAKTSFLININHEIRTPLGAILGYAELLQNASTEVEKEDYAKVIKRNGRTLTKLIDDVLLLSSGGADCSESNDSRFAPEDLLEEVIGFFQGSAKARKVSVTSIYAEKTPREIYGDPARLRQILLNIVGNALKFTTFGSVKIGVDSILAGDKVCGLRFTIADTGIGMEDEEVHALFKPFSQIDNSPTRKFGGTGLGLVLSRQLARGLGGDVVLETSRKGKGCTFVVTIGAKAATSSHAYPFESDLEDVRILLVEDCDDNQFFINQILESRRAFVHLACDGQEGVEKAIGNEYDVILMDMQMPVLDGYAATKKLRKRGYTKPIIALTAHAMIEDRIKTREAGCNAHLTKPIDTNLLVATIKKFCPQRPFPKGHCSVKIAP
jgi:signal transduction histidine kinase/ActR/RegA family two-component response regulator